MQTAMNELATEIRQQAREILLSRFRRSSHRLKADDSLLTEADLMMQEKVQSLLPGDVAMLGEEMSASEQQALLDSGEPLWILDPLDGTRNFVNGMPFFAVSLALVDAEGPAQGVVYDPVHDELFTAARGQGAWLDGQPLLAGRAVLPLEQATAIVDFKRLDSELGARLGASPPYASQRSLGSVALDWCWIAAGRAAVYLHGGQRLWDNAAGWLVLDEAGGHASTLQGEPVCQRTLDKRSAVAAADPALFGEWYEWLTR